MRCNFLRLLLRQIPPEQPQQSQKIFHVPFRAIGQAITAGTDQNRRPQHKKADAHSRNNVIFALRTIGEVYRTAGHSFWSDLARESQQEFQRSGAEGKCIEARELIIALPEAYTQYEPQQVLEDFTEEFRRRYDVECVSALHHNKRKTHYHIHLIFNERRLLAEPEVKIATRSVFFDETGKRVRTKKEITGEDGQIRKGCAARKGKRP